MYAVLINWYSECCFSNWYDATNCQIRTDWRRIAYCTWGTIALAVERYFSYDIRLELCLKLWTVGGYRLCFEHNFTIPLTLFLIHSAVYINHKSSEV